MNKKNKQDELQEIIIEIESYKKGLENISRQIQLVENTMVELNSTIEALNALSETKQGTVVLVPIGFNSFVKAEIKDTEKVIIGIGANISIEKTIENAKKSIGSRGEELKATMNRLQKTAIEANNRLSELNAESERLIRVMQGEQK